MYFQLLGYFGHLTILIELDFLIFYFYKFKNKGAFNFSNKTIAFFFFPILIYIDNNNGIVAKQNRKYKTNIIELKNKKKLEGKRF